MKNKKQSFEIDLIEHVWEKSWTYIKTVVDVVYEPILLLNSDLKVMAANESFYKTFHVEPKDTENKILHELGNGQWNIKDLQKLLKDILPKNTFFKGFEVTHDFPFVGNKVMILNARQIHFKEDATSKSFPPIILLAMEDITNIVVVAETIAEHSNKVEAKFTEKTEKLETHIKELEKKLKKLRK